MQALVIHGYGGPDVARVEEMPDPVASEGRLLVRVHAASVNPIDWKMREGYLREIFPLTFPRILGRDFSGEVVAVGAGVTDFAVGDAVYGVGAPLEQGTHAELLAIDPALVAPQPDGLDPVEAAATGVGALTALAALDRDADIQAGDRVLVHAGAGGVGVYAVQYAASRGAEVIATASAGNADFVRGLGAAQAVDYRTEDFVAAVAPCDWVLDTVGGEVHVRSQAVLKPGGTLLFVNTGPLPDYTPRPDIRIVDTRVPGGRASLERLTTLLEAGSLKPIVGRTLPLAEAAEAYRLSQSGHARGKIVLTMPTLGV